MTRAAAAAAAFCALPALANGTAAPQLCQSERFHGAFVNGLDSIDHPSISRELLALGDAAVPCLEIIAREGGRRLDLDRCRDDEVVCRSWAVRALADMKTTAADATLVRLLDEGWSGHRLYGLLAALAKRHPGAARPGVLPVLRSSDPRARSWAMLALGAIGRADDFDALVRCARGLPASELTRAARAFEFLGDPRAVAVLRQLASTLPATSRGDINGSIGRLEAGKPLRPE